MLSADTPFTVRLNQGYSCQLWNYFFFCREVFTSGTIKSFQFLKFALNEIIFAKLGQFV